MNVSKYLSIVTLQEKSTPIYVATVGGEKHQTTIHRPTGIEDNQLLYTAEGKGTCFINGRTYELTEGMLAYHPSGTPHEYHSGSGLWKTLYITFNGSGIRNFFDFDPFVCTLSKEFDFYSWYDKIYRLKQQPQYYKEISSCMYSFFLELREHIGKSAQSVRKKESFLTDAFGYLSENPRPSVDEISSRLSISAEHFCRVFKAHTGFRPMEYVNLLKLHKARELLVHSSLGISEIADKTGFESHSYFSKLFKKYVGVTPSEYRGENKPID